MTATFNESISLSTVAMTLTTPSGTTVPGSMSYNAATDTVTMQPSSALAASTLYTVTVSGAQDGSGNTMAAPFTWSFTTAGSPKVTSVTPAAGATGLAASPVVSATFNESISSSTLSFSLKGPSGVSVPAVVSYNDSTHTATLTLSAPLAGSATYTATVSNATDANGFVVTPTTWSFSTAAAPTVTGEESLAGPRRTRR